MSRRIALCTVAAMVGLLVGSVQPAHALLSFTCDSVTPSQVVPGVANQALKLHGSGFAGNPEVTFDPADGIAVVTAPVVTSSSELDVTVTVAANASTVPRAVTVTQSFVNGGQQTCAHGITVGPDISAVSGPLPNSGTNAAFTITGRAFTAGSTVRVTRSGYGYNAAETDTLTATNVTVSGDGKTINATIPTLARAPGRWKVTVQKDSSSATFGDGVSTGLQITGSEPVLTTITPAHIAATATDAQFTLVGAGYARGMTATVSGSGVSQSAAVVLDKDDPTHVVTLRLTSNGAGAPAARDLVLRNSDNQYSDNTEVLGIGVDPAPVGDPTITSVSPAVVGHGASMLSMTVTGTNFGPGPSPMVSVTPSTGVTVTSTRNSKTQLTLSITTASDVTDGARSLTVAVGTRTVTKANAFTVSSDLTVSTISPPGRPQSYDGTIVVNGAGFTGTPTVTMSPATGITLGTVTRDSAAQLTVRITVASDAPLSSRAVTVNGTASCGPSPACFTVGKVPVVSSVSPTTGNGGLAAQVTVTGAFFNDPEITLERAGQPSVAMVVEPGATATSAQGTFDLANAAPGTWGLRVTNVDGGSALLANAYTVVFASPSFADPPPDLGSVPQNTPATVLHLTGSSFAPGMSVTIPDAAGVTVTDVARKSPSAADITVATADNAALGSRDLKVTNTDGKNATCASCFAVTQGNQKQFFGSGFTAYDNFAGGGFVATGYLGGPSLPLDVITAPNAGGGPHVRAFAINPANGHEGPVSSFMAYEPGFTGGVHVAMGDIDGDGTDEIITGAGPGGGPHVRVFHVNNDTSVSQPFGNGFMAYDPNFSGGVWVGAGDVNGDGKDEIITGAGPGGGPHVRVFTLGADHHTFQEIGGFMAYGIGYTGGVAVAAGNLILEASDAPIIDEIATTPSFGGGPHVRVFNKSGAVLREFAAFGTGDVNGYRVAVGDFDFDTVDDLAISRGSSSQVYIAHVTDTTPYFEAIAAPNPEPLGTGRTVGTNLAAGDVDGDGDADLIAVPDHDAAVTVKLMRPLSHNT